MYMVREINNSMFGLRNFRGSCWVNACLQAFYRLPETQKRYEQSQTTEPDSALQTIWKSKGETGLESFFDTVKQVNLPVGRNIGDSHELFHYLCDQMNWLDSLCRFKIADVVRCQNCKNENVKHDTQIEMNVHPTKPGMTMLECLRENVTPIIIPDWLCDKCNQNGCEKQLLMVSFPKVLMIHLTSMGNPISYGTQFKLNNREYKLSSILCYNGSHWWCHSNIGNEWYTFDDQRVSIHDVRTTTQMRVLIYFCFGGE
jgi:ubiquitin C-terminal hydrolase